MKLFKRDDSVFWWYKFTFEGRQYRRSTKVENKRDAEKIAAAFRTQLANGLVDLEDRTPAPTLKDFAQEFIDYVQVRNADKPETVRFYSNRLKRLLEWEKLREMRLDRIDEALIEQYIGLRRKKVGIVSVNRELATLRRLLHVAKTLKKIKATPEVKLLPGEQSRDFVLTRAVEWDYLAACPPLLRDVAVLLLDTGLRLGEALALQWSSIHLEPVGNSRYGWIAIRDGKTKNTQRTVSLVSRVSRLLKEKQQAATSVWVFPGDTPDAPVLGTSLAHMHAKVCRPGKGKRRQYIFSEKFVLHSLRHTALTRLGEAGADSFTIMKLAGHSSVTISQRYVHPSPETVELAYDRLETLNQRALEAPRGKN
jgi:integrase